MENNEMNRAQEDAKTAQSAVRCVCRDSQKAQSEMTENMREIAQAVRECADRLLDESGNERRYLMICRMLERLEEEKRALDSNLVSSFYLDEPFLQAMMLALEWEGKWMPQIPRMPELEGACKRIEKSILCLQEEKSKCADCRDAYSAFSRETLPRFLVEVQRLADADRNGRGMRAQSVTALCGELCNHISSIIKG